MGLFTYNLWKEFAIDIFCSNERCKNKIVIDSREINNLIYCSKRCAIKDGLTEKKL